MPRWLLCDYGEVLCAPQPPGEQAAIEALAGGGGPAFWAAYWAHRPDYDRATSGAGAYWQAVCGAPVAPAVLEQLVAADVRSWLHPRPETLAAAARAAGRGWQLAVLSNAPVEVAAAIDAQLWLAPFRPRLFSCHLGAVKPEPAAYRRALQALGAESDQVVFFDDRPTNVAGARAAGLRAEQFSHPDQIDALPDAHTC